MIRVPRIKIIENQSAKSVEELYAIWVDKRLDKLSNLSSVLEESEFTDLLRLPSETHLTWSQGLQRYVLTILYNAHPSEVTSS